MKTLPLFPQQASTFAPNVDLLFVYLCAVSIFFAGLIFILVLAFAIKYHRRNENDIPKAVHGNRMLEVLWIVVPLFFVMTFFFWGADIFFQMSRPPEGAMEIYVTGKQWMWKLQHPEGRREINELHVPVGVPVKLTMTSEDVIHSFYVPAFRIKTDVLPGRYSSMWFTATKPGRYHLFCAEYCGTKHSGMVGWVTVMTPADYERWLSGGTGSSASGESMAQQGKRVFEKLRCDTCHGANAVLKAPALENLYGSTVHIAGGTTVTADDAYLRESVLKPQARIVEGYDPIMPTFEGQISETQVMQVTAYLKSLKKESTKTEASPAGIGQPS